MHIFTKKDNILYRAFHDKNGTITDQIIVPSKYREKLFKVAHDVSLSGYMGNKKKQEMDCYKISFGLGYLRMFLHIVDHVCPQCQRSVAKGRVPPMSEPFTRVVVDIVGPLNRTKGGNRYILTLCDYSTKSPKAIPLQGIDSESVAEALLEVTLLLL